MDIYCYIGWYVIGIIISECLWLYYGRNIIGHTKIDFLALHLISFLWPVQIAIIICGLIWACIATSICKIRCMIKEGYWE